MSNDIASLQAPSELKPARRAEPPPLDVGAVCFAILQAEDDAIYFRDVDGICRMANPRCAEMFGVSLEQMVGQPMTLSFPSEAACSALCQEEAVLSDGIRRGCEVKFHKQDTMCSYWMTHGIYHDEQGKVAGVFGRMHDLAERKRLEKEIVEASEREMHRIARDLHDELCQELAAVSLIARLLQRKLDDSDASQGKVATHIADLTCQMAAATRNLVYNLAPSHLDGENFVASLRNVASSICAAFPVKCGIEGAWPQSFQNPDVAIQLFRIAHEAMHNAARHSGGSFITVRLRPSAAALTLSIGDNGHGFSPANAGSPGIGLSTMKYRAGLIGGELSIESSPENGTCVACRVPMR